MTNIEDNLSKLEEFLENDLAKKLLHAFRKDAGDTSVKALLEKELTAKVPERVENDKAEVN